MTSGFPGLSGTNSILLGKTRHLQILLEIIKYHLVLDYMKLILLLLVNKRNFQALLETILFHLGWIPGTDSSAAGETESYPGFTGNDLISSGFPG